MDPSVGWVWLRSILPVAKVEEVADFILTHDTAYNKKSRNPSIISSASFGLPGEIRGHPIVISLISTSALVDEVKSVFCSSHLYLHMYPASRVVHRGDIESLVPVHNDFSYNSHICLRQETSHSLAFLTAWIPLSGESKVHGGLRLWPGTCSTKRMVKHEGQAWMSGMEDVISRLPETVRGGVVPRFKLGDVILFRPDLLHESVENLADSPRVSLDVRLFGADSITSKHYLDLDTLTKYEPGNGPCGGFDQQVRDTGWTSTSSRP